MEASGFIPSTSFPLLSFSSPTLILELCLFIYLFFVNLPLAHSVLVRGVHYCTVSVPPPLFALLPQTAMELSHLRIPVSSNRELILPWHGFILKKNL